MKFGVGAVLWVTFVSSSLVATPPLAAPTDEARPAEGALDNAPPLEPKLDDAAPALPAPHISYGRIPTYSGLVVDWERKGERIEIFDTVAYDGHLDFVVRGLARPMSSRAFSRQVSPPKTRRYFPFLVYVLPKPLVIDGKEVAFLIRPQRYRFGDTNLKMASHLARLLPRVQARLAPSVTGSGGVMLYDRVWRRPNLGAKKAFARLKIPAIAFNALLDRVGATRVEVLHAGIAVGTLVRVPAGKPPPTFGPDVIAVYDAVPNAAPVFAGVVTLEPQTPLSHVNLLAKSRGTVNVSARTLHDIAGLKDLFGKRVRLTATLDDEGRGTAMVTLATAESSRSTSVIDKKRAAHPAVKIPPATAAVRILSLGGKGPRRAKLVHLVGAKAEGYDRLARLLPADVVRPASALTFGAYVSHASRTGARSLVEKLARDRATLSRPQIASRLAAIRARLNDAPVDPKVVERVQAHLERAYPGRKVRLRSSTNVEDLPAFNGAGLYLSKGLKTNGRPPGRIRAKIDGKLRALFSSLWSERAFWEREFAGISPLAPAMAVLMHPAFVDEIGDGVALTVAAPPRPGPRPRPPSKKVRVMVAAQRGGAGVTHPDASQTSEAFTWTSPRGAGGKNKRSAPKSKRARASALRSLEISTKSSLGAVLLADDPATKRALVRFLDHTTRVHRAFVPKVAPPGRTVVGVDIEFKVMREGKEVRVYLKQARLLSSPLPSPEPRR